MVALLLLPADVLAASFDLRTTTPYPEGTIEDLDEVASVTITVDGISAALTANDGVLNQTGSGFGVNAAAAGDDTDAIDDGSGVVESVTITFNVDVFLDQITLSSLSGSDALSLVIAGQPPLILSASTTDFSMANSVAVGESIVVSFWTGNGVSFDSFTITLQSLFTDGFESGATSMWTATVP